MTASGAGVSQLKEVVKYMIDCTKTENYLAVKLRLCEIGCNGCPLAFVNNDKKISCEKFETRYPQRAIELIQQWSDQHLQKTYLSEFLEHYPSAQLNDKGLPLICPHLLGLMRREDCGADCIKCWNQVI